MSNVLDVTALDRELQGLSGWSGDPARGIRKTFECGDFNGSVAFLNQVAEIADESNHHPDVWISWDKVTLTYITHSAGAVTPADVEQARNVDAQLG